MSTTGPEPTTAHCPLCKNLSLVEHCAEPPSRTCTWQVCTDKHCTAVLDSVNRRGHCLDPQVKPSDPAHLPRRMRVVMDTEGVWRERLHG